MEEEVRKVTFEVIPDKEHNQLSFSLEIPDTMTREELQAKIEQSLQIPPEKVFALRQSINRTLFTTQLLLSDKSIGSCQVQITTKENYEDEIAPFLKKEMDFDLLLKKLKERRKKAEKSMKAMFTDHYNDWKLSSKLSKLDMKKSKS